MYVARKPAMESSSISTAAKHKQSSDCYKSGLLFTHWYAIELYNLMLDLEENNYTVTFRDRTYTILPDVLEQVSTDLEAFCQGIDCMAEGYCGITCMCSHEVTFTAKCSAHLNTILPEEARAYVDIIHQGPVPTYKQKGNPNVADIIGCVKSSSRYAFVADLKKDDDMPRARKQTALYAKHAAVSGHLKNECSLILGLAATKKEAMLSLYVVADQAVEEDAVWAIPIMDSTPYDKTLLALTAIAIADLCINPKNCSLLLNPVPFVRELSPMKYGLNCRVFLDEAENKIYKFYGEEENVLPQIDVMNLVLDTDIDKIELTTDNSYFYIKYDYYEGNHTPESLEHFYSIFIKLHKLHDKGYVHCDIRIENLVFGGNSVSYLIDLDLTRKENTRYPRGYNSEILFRHHDAQEIKPALKVHDRYSLGQICFHYFPAEAGNIVKDLASNMSLEVIANSLQTN